MRFCPMCGSKNQDDNSKCIKCHYSFSVRSKEGTESKKETNKEVSCHNSINEMISLNCSCCGGTTKISTVSNVLSVNCDYCGAKLLISESPDVVKARIQNEALEQIAEKEKELEIEKLKHNSERSKRAVRLAIILPIVGTLTIVALFLLIYLPSSSQKSSNGKRSVKITFSDEDLVGKDVDYVVERLEKVGFKDVESIGNGELIIGFTHKEGEVESVSIDGNTNFYSGEYFKKRDEVVVTYYSFD